jgi:molybdate transport system regulatory protein
MSRRRPIPQPLTPALSRERGEGEPREVPMPIRLTIRFDFDDERRLGPGKIALLESIADTGSISAAGRRHAMSYRRAWLLVEDLNRTFATLLVTAHPGGSGGGGATLTPAGERVVALYREAERKMREAAAEEIAAIVAETREKAKT